VELVRVLSGGTLELRLGLLARLIAMPLRSTSPHDPTFLLLDRRGFSEYNSGNRDLSARKWVYVSKSDIHRKGGFAKRAIPKGTTIAEYSGVRQDSPREVSAPEYLSDYVAEISGGVTIDSLDPVTKRVKCCWLL
jgi:hypothetical protein